MKRRDFLGAALAGLAAMPQASAQVNPGGRQIFSMNRKWLYGGRAVEGASEPDFDDSRFARVTLPHTNVVLPWHSFDDKDYEFVSIYRRHFRLPDSARGQRVFVDFEGAMTASTVTVNGHKFEEYKGGYTPFSFEITAHVHWDADNVLAVELDSSERSDIPPFGGNIDYLTFGGIYREVSLRVVPQTFIENVFAQPIDVLTGARKLLVRCDVNGTAGAVTVELRDGERVLKTAQGTPPEISLTGLGEVELWSLTNPKLYTVVCRFGPDEYRTRIGFREARFTPRGFHLNGQHVKLRGLNRHQTFPYVGGAMPERAQRRDGQILKKELKLNLVRTRTIRNHAIFWTRATNWDCWCSKKFRAGSTLARTRGRIWRCATPAR